MALAPDAAAINELVSVERDYGTLDPVAFRELQATFMGPLVPPTPEGLTLSEVTLGDRPTLRVRPTTRSGAALLWIHGGGWVIGSAELSLPEVYALSLALGCDVFSLDYRLAPEAPFPAAYDDAVGAAQDLLARCDEFSLDATKIAVGGDSAGGNLAAACALALTNRLCAQLLVYPATDLTRRSSSATLYAEGYLLSTPPSWSGSRPSTSPPNSASMNASAWRS
jgi:acetyl esterase